MPVSTSPAITVWTSPVRKTTSLIPVCSDVLEQVLALLRVALPGVEALVLAVVDAVGHHQRLAADHLPGRVGCAQPPLEERELAAAEQRARPVPAAAGKGDRVAAGLVVAVLALVEHHQVDRPPVRCVR